MADARVDEAASTSVKSISFGFLTAEEIRKISVKRITKAELLDINDRPVADGLYDPSLGPVYGSDLCKTCGLYSVRCPGHCGHIDFALPVYNPLLFRTLFGLLQNICFFCNRFRLKKKKVRLYAEQLELILKGDVLKATTLEFESLNNFFDESEDKADSTPDRTSDSKKFENHVWTALQFAKANFVLSRFMREKSKRCKNCEKRNPKVTSPAFGWLKMEMADSDIRKNILKDSNTTDLDLQFIKQKNSFTGELVPSKVRDMLQRVWENESHICSLIFNIRSEGEGLDAPEKGYSMFLMEALLVPPSKFRPPSKGNQQGDLLEHPQNILLIKVQENNINLMTSVSGGSAHTDVVRRWIDLQRSVNLLFDNTKGMSKADRENSGIRQLLEKKSGIFRQKMMGKRVNFACRSVISPDPYLAVNEIGIPPHFALRLTYPERVTPWNVDKLRHAIINGADIHPGAIHFKDKDQTYKLQSGRITRMSIARKLPTSRGARASSGKGPESEYDGKIVSRHIRDGDVVLVNRQPTLHKPSMMAHIVRVLKGEKTLRMHYANCSTYNADFDGDEMNVHLPQDEISRSEALNIANANKQYVVPTSGDPIRGLIQDHIISAVLLTKKDTFLTREEYDQLLYASIVPPIDSSAFLLSGSRVSLLTTDVDLQRPPPSIWKPVPLWTGKQVISAMLNHLTKGRPPFSVANTVKIPKEYLGKEKSEHKFLVYKNEFMHGVLDKNQFVKYGLVHTVQELYGSDSAGTLLSGFSRLFTVFLQIHGFTCGVDDLLIHPLLDMERERILEECEKRGKEVHYRFILSEDHHKDSLELQLEIEKAIRSNGESATARLDRMMSNALNHMTSELNKTLFPGGLQKNFPGNCLTLMTTTGAKGGMVNFTQISSLLGQQELEGKRVPRMVSGKTLPCFPPWDTASRAGGFIGDRFLTGLRPQEYYFHCMAGRDGLVDTAIKTSRSGYLQRCLIKNLESLKVSYDHTVRDADGTVVQFLYGEDGVDVHQTSYLRQFEALATNESVIREGRLASMESNAYISGLPDRLEQEATTFFRKLTKQQRKTLNLKKKSDLMKIVKLKYTSSLVQPGEPVGVLAAQSVGEPSTQMTLNTFHFAGRGEMNVTLGIPRLQEILMTAKERIRTPVMTCPLHSFITRDEADELAAKLRRITIADLLERMEVSVVPFCVMDNEVGTMYKLTGRLYSPEKYPPHFGITLESCEAVLKFDFIDALELAIKRHLDMVSKITAIHSVEVSDLVDEIVEEDHDNDDGDGDEPSAVKVAAGDDDDGVDVDDDAEDQGSDAQKRKMQEKDEIDYEDDVSEKHTTDEHDSGFESGVDQAEDEDDYSLGGQVPAEEDQEDNDEDDAEEGKESSAASEKKTKTKMTTTMKNESMSRRSRKPTDKAFFVDVDGVKFEVHFLFKNEPHILLAEVAQKAAKNVYVKRSGRIEQCSVVDDKVNGGIALETAGVNFRSFWLLDDHLDVNRIRTNDIHAMLRTYGVEAARAAIINEVKNVFNYYKISVDLRHLSLIADFMTVDGGYRPMNRIGAACFGTSPFSKMTFETATKFIVEAALHGEVDTLESPSASVCLGQPMKMGTGSFDILQNLNI